MYYSNLVKKAVNIAYTAHTEIDKGGYPYVFHPFYLATQFDDENTVCVAMLHDVVEDHGDMYSIESLSADFPKEIITALQLITHNKTTPYMDYVKALAHNPIARRVKMADLRHNMDTRRTDGKLPRKYETYKEALEYLENYENCLENTQK